MINANLIPVSLDIVMTSGVMDDTAALSLKPKIKQRGHWCVHENLIRKFEN